MMAGSSPPGTYTEIWISNEHWQRETTTPDFHLAEMVDGKKKWRLETGTAGILGSDSPEHTTRFAFPHFDIDKVKEAVSYDTPVTCVISKPRGFGGKSGLCFDRKTGLLVEHVSPRDVGDKIVDNSCSYSDYQTVLGKQFPHRVRCFENGQPIVDAKLSLSPVVVTDLAPFTPPPGAEEGVNCLGTPQPPKPTYTPDPPYPDGKSGSLLVVVYTEVGIDGKTKNLKVVGKANAPFDKLALDAVSRWRFEPATCEGEVMSVPINVEVYFRKW